MVEKLERIVLVKEVEAFRMILAERGINLDVEFEISDSTPLSDLRWLVKQLRDLARTPTSG